MEAHWVPPQGVRLKRANSFALKRLRGMLKSSIRTSTHLQRAVYFILFHFFFFFLQFARKFSRGEPITIEYLTRALQWPLSPPKVISDMTHLEAVFDILDAYKWLR